VLVGLDEFTRECLAIRRGRHFRSDDVVECLADLFMTHGVPEHVCSDNDPKFTAAAVREWLARTGARTLFIEPGSPWENGYVDSLNGKLMDELLDREVFYTLKDVEVVDALSCDPNEHGLPSTATVDLHFRIEQEHQWSIEYGLPRTAAVGKGLTDASGVKE